jgi:hypothetical protein
MQTAQLGCRHTALTQIGGRRCRPAARGHFRVQAAVLTIPREYSKVSSFFCGGASLVMRMMVLVACWPICGFKAGEATYRSKGLAAFCLPSQHAPQDLMTVSKRWDPLW